MPAQRDLRPYVREEPPLDHALVVVRGVPGWASSRASCGRTLPCTFPEPGLFSRRVFNCFPRSTDRTTRSASLCVRLEDNDLQKLVRTFGDGQKNSYYGLDRDWETSSR